jgi:peptide/nickel transport system substrate-binding protein
MLQRGTGDREVIPDPYTGLAWPQRIERAELFIKEGLPVASTLDWIKLEFVPQNDVPADAWIDWDAAAQKFITVSEKNPEGLTASAKMVVYYPANLYDLKWHDGSSFSLADIVMAWILAFDQSKPESAIYDESTVPLYESVVTSLKGMRIVQQDPLVIEYYTDQYFLDAELNVSLDNLPFPVFFPYYPQGPGAWHNLGLGIMAEAASELAFTSSKANALEVEWMSYIGGPSLAILEAKLNQAATEGYIPYAPTLGQYITAEEAAARYANLQEWYRRRGHFWIGTGAYYLDKVFPVEGTVILKHFADYPDPVSKWAGFAEPKLSVVEVDGPGRVIINQPATYDVLVTFKGEPYPQAEIAEVKYLVFDAKGELAHTGQAEAVGDGQWTITLPADVTAKLEAGSNRLEVAAVSKLVSIPSFTAFEFVTAP